MSLIVDEHRQYLSDEVRLAAFRRAVAEIVRPGSVVLDLASGTGILGLFACQAGASRVFSIEVSGMVEISRAVAAANGVADRVTVLHGLSSHVVLPGRVDAIICDQIGRFGIEAGLVAFGSDARDRFLKPGGVMLPSRVDLVLAPVHVPQLFDQVQFWDRRPAGFDFSPARHWAANTGYPAHLPGDALLGQAHVVASLDMLTVAQVPFAMEQALSIDRPGTLHGLGGWFAAQLSPSVTVTNAPGAVPRLNRRNVFFPIDRPVSVLPGDVVMARMRAIPPDMIGWSVDVRRGTTSLGRFRHSTLNGMLLSREDLARMRPDCVPALTDRGAARLSVLTLCDGHRSLAEIERAVHERHTDLFQTRAEAEAFVAEVVTRYSHVRSE